MNGRYFLLEANCQTLTNLLAQRIAYGSDSMVPYQTISHYLGGGLSRKNLFAVNEFDQAGSTILNSILLRESRNPTKPSSGNEPGNAANGETSDDDLIDLDEADRPDGPLHVREVRSNARFWSRDSTAPGPEFEQPPPFSLPEGYQEWAKSRRDCSIPERFPGPDSPYVKFIKDDTRKRFSTMVEYQQNVKAREEEVKLWHDPSIPEETRAKVVAELATKENAWLRNERVAKTASIIKSTTNDRDSNRRQSAEYDRYILSSSPE